MRKTLSLLTMLILSSALAWSQTKIVTGRVTDEKDDPIPFASIREKSTTTGVAADQDGNFSISVGAQSTLIVSAAGFEEQEISVGDRSVLAVTLKSATNLQEVVVTALGIKRTEKALGYAVSKVDPGTLVQKSEPDILKSMQGKVAGVDIRSSQGTPGAATRIQIRGNTSFFGNNEPLIVVDGIPFSNDQVATSDQALGGTAYSTGLSSLDPNDIASMNVLKGSAAAALYGSRASNGVIIITTKSGSAGRSKKGMEVTFKSSVAFEQIANLPEYQNTYGVGSYGNWSNSNGSWGAKFGTRDSIPLYDGYREAYPDMFPSDNIVYKAYPNNTKSLFRMGTVYENSIGFSGGDEKNSVALTASNLSHKGYVQNSSYKRNNIGLGGSTRLNMGINLRGNFSYSRSTQKGGYFGENQFEGSASMFARSLFLGRNWDYELPFEDENGNMLVPGPAGQFDNPLWSAKYNVATTNEDRFIANAHADYNITKWIKVDYSIGTNITTLNRNEVTEIGSRAAEQKGRLIVENYRKQEIESNLMLTLTPDIGEDFSLRGIVGTNYNQRMVDDEQNTGNEFITKGIHNLLNTVQQKFDLDYYSKRSIIGVYGDFTLGYRNYLFLNLTGRNDWSSTLPVESRSYFYPATSISFVFSDALGINNNVMDYGKIRAGWSKVGRDADPYSLQNVYSFNTNFLGQPRASLGTTYYDLNLKPEFTQEIEVGTDLSFLKRRISLNVTLYKRTSTSLLAPISLPASSGYKELYTNFGKISNKGVEVSLNLRPVQTRNFGWEIRGVFTKNKNIVEELTEGVTRMILNPNNPLGDLNTYLEAGMPYGYFRGTVAVRDDQGNLLINPQTGTLIQSTELAYVGNPNPDYKMGITNILSYKGLMLNVLFDMTKGGDLYSVTVNSLMGRGVTKDTEDRETSVVIPGVYGDPLTEKPLMDGGKTIPNQTRIPVNDLYFASSSVNASFGINGPIEFSIYDATVYRLREIALGYEFPKSIFNKTPIGSMSLTFTGRNLWYLAPNFPKYTNFDPEVGSFGTDNSQGFELSAAPTTKRYGINLLVTF